MLIDCAFKIIVGGVVISPLLLLFLFSFAPTISMGFPILCDCFSREVRALFTFKTRAQNYTQPHCLLRSGLHRPDRLRQCAGKSFSVFDLFVCVVYLKKDYLRLYHDRSVNGFCLQYAWQGSYPGHSPPMNKLVKETDYLLIFDFCVSFWVLVGFLSATGFMF